MCFDKELFCLHLLPEKLFNVQLLEDTLVNDIFYLILTLGALLHLKK